VRREVDISNLPCGLWAARAVRGHLRAIAGL